MRITKLNISTLVAVSALLLPGNVFGASREQQEMQRDIAQLQDQVRTLQSSFDQKMGILQTLVQQALDAGNKANTGVTVLNSSVTATLDRELRDRLAPVAASTTGLSTKVDNLNNDMAEVRNSVADVNTQVNKILQLLTDVNNAIKVMQAPAAAPPPQANGPQGGAFSSFGVGGPSSALPPVAASTLFTNAMRDYSSGKGDLAAAGFTDFVKFYPDDPNAPTAQLYIGQVHLADKPEQAVKDFDAVLERFPDSKVTPDAWFMKGMALEQSGHRDQGAKEFRALIKQYPTSDQAKQAKDQLKSMGLSSPPPPAPVRRRQ